MLRISTALLVLGFLICPTVASAKDDCTSDSNVKTQPNKYAVRFEVNLKNNTRQTLTADFYKIADRGDPLNPPVPKKIYSKALSPDQKISIRDGIPFGSTTRIETRLESTDGALNFGPTYFSIWHANGEKNAGNSKIEKGPFDTKIICDRRWSAADARWIINYVINPK